MERKGWFDFSEKQGSGKGYAAADGKLKVGFWKDVDMYYQFDGNGHYIGSCTVDDAVDNDLGPNVPEASRQVMKDSLKVVVIDNGEFWNR